MSRDILSHLPRGLEDRILCGFRYPQHKHHNRHHNHQQRKLSGPRAHLRLYNCREEFDFTLAYLRFAHRFWRRTERPSHPIVTTSVQHLDWPSLANHDSFDDDVIALLTHLANQKLVSLQPSSRPRNLVIPFMFNRGNLSPFSSIKEHQGLIVISPKLSSNPSIATSWPGSPTTTCISQIELGNAMTDADEFGTEPHPDTLSAFSERDHTTNANVVSSSLNQTNEIVHDSDFTRSESPCLPSNRSLVDVTSPPMEVNRHFGDESTYEVSVAETGDNIAPTDDSDNHHYRKGENIRCQERQFAESDGDVNQDCNPASSTILHYTFQTAMHENAKTLTLTTLIAALGSRIIDVSDKVSIHRDSSSTFQVRVDLGSCISSRVNDVTEQPLIMDANAMTDSVAASAPVSPFSASTSEVDTRGRPAIETSSSRTPDTYILPPTHPECPSVSTVDGASTTSISSLYDDVASDDYESSLNLADDNSTACSDEEVSEIDAKLLPTAEAVEPHVVHRVTENPANTRQQMQLFGAQRQTLPAMEPDPNSTPPTAISSFERPINAREIRHGLNRGTPLDVARRAIHRLANRFRPLFCGGRSSLARQSHSRSPEHERQNPLSNPATGGFNAVINIRTNRHYGSIVPTNGGDESRDSDDGTRESDDHDIDDFTSESATSDVESNNPVSCRDETTAPTMPEEEIQLPQVSEEQSLKIYAAKLSTVSEDGHATSVSVSLPQLEHEGEPRRLSCSSLLPRSAQATVRRLRGAKEASSESTPYNAMIEENRITNRHHENGSHGCCGCEYCYHCDHSHPAGNVNVNLHSKPVCEISPDFPARENLQITCSNHPDESTAFIDYTQITQIHRSSCPMRSIKIESCNQGKSEQTFYGQQGARRMNCNMDGILPNTHNTNSCAHSWPFGNRLIMSFDPHNLTGHRGSSSAHVGSPVSSDDHCYHDTQDTRASRQPTYKRLPQRQKPSRRNRYEENVNPFPRRWYF